MLEGDRSDQITVLISHRLAGVVACDRIYVFGDGRILESGTHAQLMALGNEYAQLFTLQAAAYRDNTPRGQETS